MKKVGNLQKLLALALSITMLAACNNTNKPADNEAETKPEVEESQQEENTEVEEEPENEEGEAIETEEEGKGINEGGMSPENAGTYEAVAPGYGGDIKVSVIMDEDGSIKDIEILEDMETVGVGKVALDLVKKRIVEGQSTNVDSVTGATASSKGLMLATGKALEEAGLADNFKEEYKEEREYPSEIEADVVIVGGGGAGLTAAVEAAKAGSNVVVVEKNGYVGGNTILSGGAINAPDPEEQEKQGIEDSNELYYEQTMEAGDNVANPDLVRVLADNAYDGYQWLKSIGVEFEDEIYQVAGGLHPRAHQAVKPNGVGFIEGYVDSLVQDNNAQILTETTAEHLIVEDGRVVGVEAKNFDGSPLTLHAKQAVILATGGFAKNTDMVVKYKDNEKWPNLDENTISTNLDSIRGDGIVMGEEAGADLVDMDQMQFLYLGIPDRGPITGLLDLAAEKTLFVNKEGKRFVREDGRRDVISKAIFDQPDGEYWLIHSSDGFDFDSEKTIEKEDFKKVLEEGKYGWVIGETLEDLAEKINVPYENLQASIDEYNKCYHEKAEADEFGRTLFEYPFEKGPFVAVPREPSLHHTMGGLRIDTDTHVLDAEGNIVPGLYAAGEVTGGIHGGNRVGGNAITDTVVFGRIAGQNAAKEAKN